jgi:hypothetical protein
VKTLCILVLIILSNYSASAEWDVESRRIEAEQVAMWKRELSDANQADGSVVIEKLWLGLRNLGHRRKYNGHDPSVEETFRKIQSKLLSVPGHARYFGNRIKYAYEPLKSTEPQNHINSAQNEMMYGFETLSHLPSPECVQVLGEMLSETWRMAPTGGYTPPPLAEPAMKTLGSLGIRDAPWKPITTRDDYQGAAHAWQDWYAKIKSGKLTFSFKGQASEYRFKSDGTWDTITIVDPPDDGLKPPEERKSDGSESAELPPSPLSSQVQSRLWTWFIIVMLAGLTLAVWLGLRRTR